jgi:hypothetical protein
MLEQQMDWTPILKIAQRTGKLLVRRAGHDCDAGY